MKILITSGGTSEAIDRVRSITNHSTGQLGKIIAETFLQAGYEVSLVTTKRAVKPREQVGLTLYLVESVADVEIQLNRLVPTHDLLIHAMAISDYRPVYMAGLSEARQVEDISQLLERTNQESKISSKEDVQVLLLEKTPKLIAKVKEWNPAIRLIGFKLLVDVSKEELIAVARDSLVRNQADYIVANDLTAIHANGHQAYLVSQDAVLELATKEDIAQTLLKIVKENHHG